MKFKKGDIIYVDNLDIKVYYKVLGVIKKSKYALLDMYGTKALRINLDMEFADSMCKKATQLECVLKGFYYYDNK